MPRQYGYAARGERCHGTHDWHAKGRTNVIGALLGKNLLTRCLFDTSIDSDIFCAFLIQDLLPKIPKNSVLVMDNAAFHKRSDIQTHIHKAGFTLQYLPPYSPDLNPIEHKWAQAKARRRTLQCSIHELFSCDSL
jgi:transposase